MPAKITCALTLLRIFNPRPIADEFTRMHAPFPPHTTLNQWPVPLATWKGLTSPKRVSSTFGRSHVLHTICPSYNIILRGRGFCSSSLAGSPNCSN